MNPTLRDRGRPTARLLSCAGLVCLGLSGGCAHEAVAGSATAPRRLSLTEEERARYGGVQEVDAGAGAAVVAGSGDAAGGARSGGLSGADDAGVPRAITRASLVPFLDQGFGSFLGRVRVTAVLQAGRFQGFRFDAFRDPEGLFTGVDLAPGDLITRVNGSPIERPEQALSVWNGLRVVSELCVEYRRGGVTRELRIPIVD